MQVEADARVQRARPHEIAAWSFDGSRLTRKRGFVEDGVGFRHTVDRDHLSRLDEEPVPQPDLVDRARSQLGLLVSVDQLRGSLQQGGELTVSAPVRIGLERLAGRKHQCDHGARQVFVEPERNDDRQERDEIDAGLSPRDRPDHVHDERDPTDHGRDGPGKLRAIVRAGDPHRRADRDADDRGDQPHPIEVARRVHGSLRSSARRCRVFGVVSVAMNSS